MRFWVRFLGFVLHLQGKGLPVGCRHGSKALLALLRTADGNIISQEANDAMQRGAKTAEQQALAGHDLKLAAPTSGLMFWNLGGTGLPEEADSAAQAEQTALDLDRQSRLEDLQVT